MGRFVGKAVPNNDPARLQRVLDEKTRMIGVDVAALDMQAQERRAREAREAAELRAFAQAAVRTDGQLCASAAASELQRRGLAQALEAVCSTQAAERSQREAHQRAAEAAAGFVEQAAALASPWLNEDPRLQQSAMSPHRVRKDHYKSMSEQQREAIRATQAAQVVAKAAAEEQKRAQQAAYDRQQAGFVGAMARQAAQVEATKRQEAGRLAQELQKQILEKRERDGRLNQLYNSQKPTEGFFSQFGTSHR